ncbi:MAG: DUF2680 domain-containing protein [Chloroflexota bacterium]|nr:DUF2680 domain-containing protein [Chloroflexota bacterium]
MNKRAKILAATLVLAGLLAVSVTGVALAAGPNSPDGAPLNCGGMGCSDTVSELLGLTPQEIQTQRQAGKSLVEIAAAKGVTENALVNAIMAAKKEAVQARVQAGTLTQEQANLMLQQMEQRTKEAVNRTTTGPLAGERGYGCGQPGQGTGPGMMRAWGQGTGNGAPGNGTGPGGMNRWARS